MTRGGAPHPVEDTGASSETIAAIATASGPAGVGIVRLSGPQAIAIASSALGIDPAALGREVRLGRLSDLQGRHVDQVLAFAMRAPGSFTGEDVAELHGHGGVANLAAVLACVVERGARLAAPGEFTRRAVLNGKLDLMRAEALLEVIHAGSERGLRLAQRNLDGELGRQIADVERRALSVLAEIEGRIDFPEEDLPAADAEVISRDLDAISTACRRLCEGFRRGRALTQGITVALVGPVNVGKSSLLNALVGAERALVAPTPGTTRDWLEVRDEWEGVAVTLVDTAGTRDTADDVELRGIALGARRVETADVVLVLHDADHPVAASSYGGRAVHVRTKVDLRGSARGVPEGSSAGPSRSEPEVVTSAVTGEGLDRLRAVVLAVAGVADAEGSEHGIVTTARQHALADAARTAFTVAAEQWARREVPEVIAVEVRHGAEALAQLRGLEVGERVLDELFARFCIGK